MSEIKSFPFSKDGINNIKDYKYGSNWPVVYILENGKEAYVGETTRAYVRSRQHTENPERKRLHTIHVVSDDESNKSSTLDIESSLIEYMVADGKFKIQNGNKGLQNHEYYDRERYQSKFEVLWGELQEMGLAKKDWREIKDSDLFKYSPYKTLTDDQYFVARKILSAAQDKAQKYFVVHGGPGTGKTIVATYILKRLVDEGVTNVALVIAMTPLRKTLKKVFKSIPGLSAKMVIGPAETLNQNYDVLLVDETHRLRRRKNIPNYGSFDEVNRSLGLDNTGDELDWVLQGAKKVILFYDAKQSVRPSDILPEKITALNAQTFELRTQMRVKGGEEYIDFVEQLLENKCPKPYKQTGYDFKIFSNFTRFIAALRQKEKQHKLSRMVAGYAWEWKSRIDPTQYDIEIENHKLFWNSKLSDWVNSPKAPDEVGCIHTIQGYDLNYAGVIIGPELSYDPEQKQIIVIKNNYQDANGHRGVSDPDELQRYVINIYKTLLTRGILGTYVYVVDDNLREYIQKILNETDKKNFHKSKMDKAQTSTNITSPYERFVSVPLYDSVGCGDAMFAESIPEDVIDVSKDVISPGAKYFALRTRGDSMNKLGIEDGDIILCQKNYQAPSGSIAVVQIGDDATLKEIRYEEDGLVLVPKSTNQIHETRKLTSDDEFKVLGVFISKVPKN